MLHKPLRGKKEWQTDCFTHSDVEQLFNNVILWVQKEKGKSNILLMETIFYRQILKGRKQRQTKNTAVCTEGCKKGGPCQIYTSISLRHSDSVLQGCFPSRCWSICPCQGRGFEVDTVLGGRCSPTGPRLHKFCGWKPVCSFPVAGHTGTPRRLPVHQLICWWRWKLQGSFLVTGLSLTLQNTGWMSWCRPQRCTVFPMN